MKKCFLLGICALFVSCSFFMEEDLLTELPTVTSVEKAWKMSANIRYVADGPNGYCRSPLETYTLGIGDCEDIATLFVALVNKMGREAYIVVINGDTRDTYHAIALVGGQYIEPQVFGYYVDIRRYYIYGVFTVTEALTRLRSIQGVN